MGCYPGYFAKFYGFGENQYAAINSLRINMEKKCTKVGYYESINKNKNFHNIKYVYKNVQYDAKIDLLYNEKRKIWGAFVY